MKALRTIIESNFRKDYNQDYKDTVHLHKKLVAHYKNFSYDHEHEIQQYTTSDMAVNSYPLNDYQWKKHEYAQHGKEYSIDHLDARTNRMDSVINAHRTPNKLTVYSGIKYDPRTRMDANRIVHHPAYLSTSLMKYQAKGFGMTEYKKKPPTKKTSKTREDFSTPSEEHTHVLNIKVPKNHPGAYVAAHSRLSAEKEFILPRGTNLKYIHTQHHYVEDPYSKGRFFHIHEHHMEVV